MTLGKPNVKAGRGGDALQRYGRLGKGAVGHAGGEDRERLAAAAGSRCSVPVGAARQLRRPSKGPAEGRAGPQDAVGERGPFPQAEQRPLAQRLPAAPPVLEDLPRQRDVDGACLLAGVALGAERVGQVCLGKPVVERREHQADRAVVDMPELVTADGHERRARVGARAAADAGERVAENRIVAHALAAVVEDHAVHLARAVHADRQGLLDVRRARWPRDPVDVARDALTRPAAREHSQLGYRVFI